MTVNFKAAPWETMMTNFGKTLSRTPVTKTNHALNNEEVLTDGTAVSITGCLFRRETDWTQERAGLFEEADAVLMVQSDVTINQNDKITYDSETYRVEKVVTRRLGTTAFNKTAQLFKIS